MRARLLKKNIVLMTSPDGFQCRMYIVDSVCACVTFQACFLHDLHAFAAILGPDQTFQRASSQKREQPIFQSVTGEEVIFRWLPHLSFNPFFFCGRGAIPTGPVSW